MSSNNVYLNHKHELSIQEREITESVVKVISAAKIECQVCKIENLKLDIINACRIAANKAKEFQLLMQGMFYMN